MPHRGSSYAVKGSISKPNPPEILRIGYAHPDSTFGLSDKCDEALFFLSAVRQLPPESDASVRQSSSPAAFGPVEGGRPQLIEKARPPSSSRHYNYLTGK
jgi:hypothetical protein